MYEVVNNRSLLEELKKRNPVTEKGYHDHPHYRHLTAEIGHPSLTRHLYELIGIMMGDMRPSSNSSP